MRLKDPGLLHKIQIVTTNDRFGVTRRASADVKIYVRALYVVKIFCLYCWLQLLILLKSCDIHYFLFYKVDKY